MQQVIEMARSQTPSDQYETCTLMPIQYRLDEEAGLANRLGGRERSSVCRHR